MARRLCTTLFAFVLLSLGAAGSATAANTITVEPTNPTGGNAFPFGQGTIWPTAGFIYQNLPAVQLKTGDTIAFDLGATNPEADIQLQIAMAATTVNGGDAPAQPFTTVVNNTQTPLNPKGNGVTGDYELQFKSEAPFSFSGGGLIIRFSAPSAGYAADNTGTTNLFNVGLGTDPSGFFVKRFYNDPDGLPIYNNSDGGDIAAFRLIIEDPPATQPPGSQPPQKKKKCKKKKKRSLAAAAKKKCKKKKK
jgi:hypothetical protein